MAKVSRFRSAKNSSLLESTKKSFETREASGKYRNYLAGGLPIPEWKCKSGEHIIDIIPFLAGDNHPKTKKDHGTYLMDLWVHMGVGVNEDMHVCPARNYGKPCPICEYIEEAKKQTKYDEAYIKTLYPKRRVVYNIICWDSQEEINKGVQIWEASHYLTEANISAIANNRRTGGFVEFADPDMDKGKSIEFTREGSGNSTKHSGTKFSDRDYHISDEQLDTALILDEWIMVTEYKELEKAFYGDIEEDNTGEPEEVIPEEEVDDLEAAEENGYNDAPNNTEVEAEEDLDQHDVGKTPPRTSPKTEPRSARIPAKAEAKAEAKAPAKTPTEIRTARAGASRTIQRVGGKADTKTESSGTEKPRVIKRVIKRN